MNGFWGVILILGSIYLLTNNSGISSKNKKKLIKMYKKLDTENKELKEMRIQDNKVIEDLQKRLEDAGLDSSIG